MFFFSRKKKSAQHKIQFFINYQTKNTPWGGGNQFLKALSSQLKKTGHFTDRVQEADCILFNSHQMIDQIKAYKAQYPAKKFIHRIDGPIHLVRGQDEEVDDQIFTINNEIADLSVFQSNWSFSETLKLNYKPKNPVIICNTADPKLFNSQGSKKYEPGKKIKLIASSWSDNPRKGAAVYEWLDQNLDWNRFEFSFVGRIKSGFENIKMIKPVTSEKLGRILKEHDIFITASQNDPCSNALIEALACGLPVLFLNQGGHPEIVKSAGLAFNEKEEIPALLELFIEYYPFFQRQIRLMSIEEITRAYINAALKLF